MAATTTMTYGAYSFSPVPFIEISKEITRSGDDSPIQEVTSVTITGTIVASNNLQGDAGIENLKTRIDALRDAFKDDCQLFLVQCGAVDIVRAYPKIVTPPQFSTSNNNWTLTTEFTITLQFAVEVGESTNYTENVKATSESWSLEFADEYSQYTETIDTGQDATPYALVLTHELSAEGIAMCSGTGSGGYSSDGWEEARDWVIPRLGYDSTRISDGASGVINVDVGDLGVYSHMRTNNQDEVNGSFAATETWLLVNTGISGLASAGATEDFTVTVTTAKSSPNTTVRVEGSIQGLEVRDYGTDPGDFTITTDKYANASSYWSTVQNRLYARAKAVSDPLSLNRSLHTDALSYTIAHAKAKGAINYTYEYDNRVCFLLETGSLSGSVLSEIITVNDSNHTDVFAVIPVLGRPNGPVLQEISTTTELKRDVSIEVLVDPPTGCSITLWNAYRDQVKSGVADILCEFQTELTDAADQVFKHQDNESWVAQQGRYSRNIGWTYQECSGTGSTTVC